MCIYTFVRKSVHAIMHDCNTSSIDLFVHLILKLKGQFTYGHHTYEQATGGDDFIVTVIDNMAKPCELDFSKLATTFTQLKLSGLHQITKREWKTKVVLNAFITLFKQCRTRWENWQIFKKHWRSSLPFNRSISGWKGINFHNVSNYDNRT